MKNIKIVPIFNQSVPGVWDDFLRIRKNAILMNYGHTLTQGECENFIRDYENAWKKRAFNFAFGAYNDTEMVGFVQGDCMKSVATIRGLYVLPEFQTQNIGSVLLRHAECAAQYGARSADLISLGNAINFYVKKGYSPIFRGSNEMVKKMTGGGHCDTIPVFKPTAAILRACDRISRDNNTIFNANGGDFGHRNMFVYVDVHSEIQAYAIGEMSDSDKYNITEFNISKHQPVNIIRARMERAFAAVAGLHAIYNQKTK